MIILLCRTRGRTRCVGYELRHVKRVNSVDSGPHDHHQDTCVKRHLSEAIDDSSCTTWLHQTNVIQRNFGAPWGDAWMHYDDPIKD